MRLGRNTFWIFMFLPYLLVSNSVSNADDPAKPIMPKQPVSVTPKQQWVLDSPTAKPDPEKIHFESRKPDVMKETVWPKAQPFISKDNKKGWKFTMRGNAFLRSLAVQKGKVFLGSDYYHGVFLSLNIDSGAVIWSSLTGEVGPIGAVVSSDCVAYNTNSCTLNVHNAEKGGMKWSKLICDPLVSQPAIGGGKVFTTTPFGILAAFDLKTGEELWTQRIRKEVFEAPVYCGNFIYAATWEGCLYKIDAQTGVIAWVVQCGISSAPRIEKGKIYISKRKIEEGYILTQGYNVLDDKTGEPILNEAIWLKFPNPPKPNDDVQKLFRQWFDYLGRYARECNMLYRAQCDFIKSAASVKKILQGSRYKKGSKEESKLAKDIYDMIEQLSKYQPARELDVASPHCENMMKISSSLESLSKIAGARLPKEMETEISRLQDYTGKIRNRLQAANDLELNWKIFVGQKMPHFKFGTLQSDIQAYEDGYAIDEESFYGYRGKEKGQVVRIYLGSKTRPILCENKCVFACAGSITAFDRETNKEVWSFMIPMKQAGALAISTPAFAGGRLYYGLSDGRVIGVSMDGKIVWEADVEEPVMSEPVIYKNKILFTTSKGSLFCLDTGEKTEDEWPMWGGSAGHNGPEAKKR